MKKSYAVNDAVEDMRYFPREIFTVEDYIKCCTITSIDNFRYSYRGYNSPASPLSMFTYNYNFLRINKYLRGVELDDIIECDNVIKIMDDFISHSPILNIPMVLYRGIDTFLDVQINDVINNMGFMYCSLDVDTAKFYMYDTKNCYTENRIQWELYKKSTKGATLLKINVPSGIKFLDVSYYDHSIQEVKSEIILNRHVWLKVVDISDSNGYRCIETNLIDVIES